MGAIHKTKVTVVVWVIMGILPMVHPFSSFAATDTPTAGQMWKEPVTGMEFVWVPEGCYEMGCGSWASDCTREEKPAHEVCVDGFWMGKTEVTQGQWRKVMGDNPSRYQKGDDYPVENVFWGQTREFTEKLSALSDGAYEFRLPTEAEWEYACRSGGKEEKYAGGKEPDEVAWYHGNSKRTTHPVATKEANGLGLHDMTGNVNEWCEDKYDGNAYSKHQRTNPIITTVSFDLGMYGAAYVSRGGSWAEKPKKIRCGSRAYFSTSWQDSQIGFRLVRSK